MHPDPTPSSTKPPNTLALEPAKRCVIGAIPARYASTRLPGKPLLVIAGKPMIQHVVERALQANGLERVVVLTDDERIVEAVESFGGDVEMTPAELTSGTDRIAWAARGWNASAVINIQGDEPLIDPIVIDRVAQHLLEHPDDPMVTLAAPATATDGANPNAVKVVLDQVGYALYFSRAAIPFPRVSGETGSAAESEEAASGPYWKHIGLYGYQRATLLELARLEATPLESLESLEQLRALENGIRIRVLPTTVAAPGVDTREDLLAIERLLSASGNG